MLEINSYIKILYSAINSVVQVIVQFELIQEQTETDYTASTKIKINCHYKYNHQLKYSTIYQLS